MASITSSVRSSFRSVQRNRPFGLLLGVVNVYRVLYLGRLHLLLDVIGRLRRRLLLVDDLHLRTAVVAVVVVLLLVHLLVAVLVPLGVAALLVVLRVVSVVVLLAVGRLVALVVVVVVALLVVLLLAVVALLVAALVVFGLVVTALREEKSALNDRVVRFTRCLAFLWSCCSWNPPSFSCSPPSWCSS